MKNEPKGWNDFGGNVGKYCRNCEERHVGCHGECTKYLAEKAEYEKYKAEVKKNKDKDKVHYSYLVETLCRQVKIKKDGR